VSGRLLSHWKSEGLWFAGGAVYVDFQGFVPGATEGGDPREVLEPVLRLLGVAPDGIPIDRTHQEAIYQDLLEQRAQSRKPVLLVLDNMLSYAQIKPLLPDNPVHSIIVSSRRAFAELAGSRSFQLSPLSAPKALALLRMKIDERIPDDSRVQEDPGGADEVARLCGGFPLALNISSALLADEPERSLTDYAASLEHLGIDAFEYDDWSIRGAFHLSYSRLPERAAQTFRLLDGAPGADFSTSAAAILLGQGKEATRQELRSLSRAYLVVHSGADRWHLHDLLKLYARERASAESLGDDATSAVDRLYKYYDSHLNDAIELCELGTIQHANASFEDQASAFAWLSEERDVLLAAVFDWARSPTSSCYAASIAIGIAPYLSSNRHMDSWLSSAAAGVAAAEDASTKSVIARALLNYGSALAEFRQYEESLAALTQGLKHLGPLRNGSLRGAIVDEIGCQLLSLDRPDEAARMHRKAVRIFQRRSDTNSRAMALVRLGSALRDAGRPLSAMRCHQRAVEVFARSNNIVQYAGALTTLGNSLQRVERLEQALAAHKKAQEVLHATGHTHQEALALNNWAACLRQLGEHDEAIIRMRESLGLYRESRDRFRQALVLRNMGMTFGEAGQYAVAIKHSRDAAQIYGELGDLALRAHALNDAGVGCRLSGLHQQSVRLHRAALQDFSTAGTEDAQVPTLIKLALAYHEMGNMEEEVAECRHGIAKIDPSMRFTTSQFEEFLVAAGMSARVQVFYRVQ
jgi:tetratricopeptide (TPR) repeat protein